MQNPIIRAIVATIAAMLVAGVVVGLTEAAGHLIFPPPPGIDVTNPADQARLMELVPLGAKIAVVFAWFLGALAGCSVATVIGRTTLPGWIVAALLIAASLFTTQMFPHPLWMIVAAVALPIVAKLCADRLFAARLTR